MPIRHLPISARIALVVLGTLGVAGFWAYLLIAPPRAEPFSPPPGAAGTGAAMRVTFVGDAFTAPTTFGGRDAAAYPALLASRFGWQATTIGEDGAGYVARGVTGARLPDDESRIAASRPDLVVFFAGRDDRSLPPRAVAAAGRAFYDQLRRDPADRPAGGRGTDRHRCHAPGRRGTDPGCPGGAGACDARCGVRRPVG